MNVNKDKKQFPLVMPTAMYDKLEILMIDIMQKRHTRLDMTKFILEILSEYLKVNGQHTDQLARDRIVEGVERCKNILEKGKVNQTTALFWVETLRPYRFNLDRKDPLDREVANLILSCEKIAFPSKEWKNLE